MVKLTDTEWKIMEELWKRDSMTTMELIRELEISMGWAKSTVITLLNRMDAKGHIRYEMEGKSKRYFPNVSKNEAELEETKSFLNRFYGGNIGLMISNLISQEVITKEELDEIHKIIEEGE